MHAAAAEVENVNFDSVVTVGTEGTTGIAEAESRIRSVYLRSKFSGTISSSRNTPTLTTLGRGCSIS